MGIYKLQHEMLLCVIPTNDQNSRNQATICEFPSSIVADICFSHPILFEISVYGKADSYVLLVILQILTLNNIKTH